MTAAALAACAWLSASALSVERAIEWTSFGPAGEQAIVFSPSGQRAAVVLETPDIAANLVRSRLMLVDLSAKGSVTEIAALSSSSNDPAIRAMQWSDDDALWFIGEQPHARSQLFRYSFAHRELQQITHSTSDVLTYLADNDRIVFAARVLRSDDWFDSSATTGYTVQGWETLAELQNSRNVNLDWLPDYALFVADPVSGSAAQVDVPTVRQDPHSLRFSWASADHRQVLANVRLADRDPPPARHGFATEPILIDLAQRTWQRSAAAPVQAAAPPRGALHLTIEESNDTPPRLVATARSGKRRVLLDPNRGAFAALPKWTEIEWQARDGRNWRGGLLLPNSGKPPFPLVMQTHGYARDKFLISGPYTTAFAAQPLASRGYAVLQIADNVESIAGAAPALAATEAAVHLAGYEGAIESLANRKLIDPDRLGLVGFSRTCYHVKYALVFSRYRFSAVVASDGVDMGYGQYLAWLQGMDPQWTAAFEQRNGGIPFAGAVTQWAERVPHFNLTRVRGALRTEVLAQYNVGLGWEMHAGLRRLGLPAQYVIYTDGAHELFKPAQRRASMQGTVDWMVRYLK